MAAPAPVGTGQDVAEFKSTPSSNVDLEKGSDASALDDKEIESQTTPVPAVVEQPPPSDPNLVEWDGPDDPGNPLNWSYGKRWLMTIILALNTWMVTFASSVTSSAIGPLSEEYHVAPVVATLATSLFIVGWGLGPLIWGPGSEAFGRKRPLYLGYAIFTIMQIPVAVAQNLHTILICRFVAGVFGSAPLAVVGGIYVDIWAPVDRGIALSIVSTTTFTGPIAAPIIGSFITQSHLGWRWTAWITLIGGAFFGVLGLFFVPESSHARLLQIRAKKLRHETKNWALHSKADEQPLNYNTVMTVYLTRPFKMLFSEPILLLITIYTSYIYGILYLFFEAYPVSFQEERHWSGGVSSLPLLSLLIGVLIATFSFNYHGRTRYARLLKEQGRVAPEERLVPMMFGSVLLPIGLFWFGWTSSAHISWVPQVLSGIFIGCGLFLIFIPGLSYQVDVYLWFANSALSANTFVRSMLGGAFPLFATAMYHQLGVDWASSLLGFLSIAMMPAPFLFFIYGARIRAMSKFAPKLP
ncbi:major facilitator superfamily domain-containing protein [Xylogone sp. PMI_703]|nr:major facilitator superfamily domain-containing protein [Xylogone sp. PMI_703]